MKPRKRSLMIIMRPSKRTSELHFSQTSDWCGLNEEEKSQTERHLRNHHPNTVSNKERKGLAAAATPNSTITVNRPPRHLHCDDKNVEDIGGLALFLPPVGRVVGQVGLHECSV